MPGLIKLEIAVDDAGEMEHFIITSDFGEFAVDDLVEEEVKALSDKYQVALRRVDAS